MKMNKTLAAPQIGEVVVTPTDQCGGWMEMTTSTPSERKSKRAQSDPPTAFLSEKNESTFQLGLIA